MLFVILNSFITVIVILAGWRVIGSKVAQYNAGFLIMSGLLNGIFSSLDAMLFYVFFEASLILYIIIGVWGGPRRVYAAFKFFLFHFDGVFAVPDLADLPFSEFRQLRDTGLAPIAVVFDSPEMDFPGFPGGFRSEGAYVAGAHVVA